MNQSALDRFVADVGNLRKPRHDCIHYGAAFAGPQRMTRNAAGFVHDDERWILEWNLEAEISIRIDCDQCRWRFDLDIVAGIDDRALDATASVEQYRAARHHLARIAPRSRMTGAHQVVVESLGARIIQ